MGEIMEIFVNKIKTLPLSVKISEIIYTATILIYIYMLSGGGLYTAYYSFMIVMVTAALTSVYLISFKKNYVFAIINLLIAAIIFIKFASMA